MAAPWSWAPPGSPRPSRSFPCPSGRGRRRRAPGVTSGLLLQAAVSGILLGGVYGLVASGLTLIFGVLRIINFAHGAVMMLAMYTSYWLFALYGVDPYVSILVTVPLFFAIGAGIERTI